MPAQFNWWTVSTHPLESPKSNLYLGPGSPVMLNTVSTSSRTLPQVSSVQSLPAVSVQLAAVPCCDTVCMKGEQQHDSVTVSGWQLVRVGLCYHSAAAQTVAVHKMLFMDKAGGCCGMQLQPLTLTRMVGCTASAAAVLLPPTRAASPGLSEDALLAWLSWLAFVCLTSKHRWLKAAAVLE